MIMITIKRIHIKNFRSIVEEKSNRIFDYLFISS